MTVSGYCSQRVILHGLSAAVILWTLLSGFLVAGFGVFSPLKEPVAFLNISLTTVFIPFYVRRLFLFFTVVGYIGAVIVHQTGEQPVLGKLSLRPCGKSADQSGERADADNDYIWAQSCPPHVSGNLGHWKHQWWDRSMRRLPLQH